MYTVRVEATFSAAHFLSHYRGACERMHGHNYRVWVSATGGELDEGGMLCDFGLLKSALRTVLADLDHRCLNDIPVFLDDPSAERIARYIYENVRRTLPDAPVSLVEVFETDTSMASWSP